MAKSTQKKLPLPPPNTSRLPVYDIFPARVMSRESLGLVLAELARLEAVEAQIQAEAKLKLDAAAEVAAREMCVTLPRSPKAVSFADWRQILKEAAQKFCDENRAELLKEGRKSEDFTHGRIGWQDEKLGLVPLDDFDDHGNPRIPDKLLGQLRAHLQEIATFTSGGARFIDVKVAWRKSELLKAFKDQDISLSVLAKAGFELNFDPTEEPPEEFYIKTFIGTPTSETSK